MSTPSPRRVTGDTAPIKARFCTIFRRIHAQHPNCLRDEWLHESCRLSNGLTSDRPIVWSRRNGPWQQSDILWIGAAPGNAGGKGSGPLGAHGTRIPFGGDIAGANLEVLLSSIGLHRNRTFIAASLNQLPTRGGGEPTIAELKAPVGDYASSLHVVCDTILAVGPALLIALGNVALRVCLSAVRDSQGARNLPSVEALQRLGLARNMAVAWPSEWPPGVGFLNSWRTAWAEAPLPHILWLTHPSAQNMSPYAGRETVFHSRMLEARNALQLAVQGVLGWHIPEQRPVPPDTGIYALAEWRELIAPRLYELDRLWRARGV